MSDDATHRQLEHDHRPEAIRKRLLKPREQSVLGRSMVRGGAETLLTGGVAAALAYLIGAWLRQMFGGVNRLRQVAQMEN